MKEINRQLAVIRRGAYYISAVLEGNTLDNVILEEADEQALRVGDIYVGRVDHVVKNIQAAFVEVQKHKMCYLPLKECVPQKVTAGQEFAVQVKKAAVKAKQAVVTRNLEFAGKYAVVTVLNRAKAISANIKEETVRARLRRLLAEYEDAPFGIILRTNCQEAEEEQIREECEALLRQAETIVERSKSRVRFTKVYRSEMEVVKYIRSRKSGAFDRIITDEREIYEKLRNESTCPDETVVFYEDHSYPLDKLLGISAKLEKAGKKHVWLKSGGSLVIEPTEALTVIDVNTEKAIGGKRNSETTFFRINVEAAKEAARQIRIRNLSGIILIDFIGMKEREHEEALLSELRREFEKDPVRTAVVDMTKLGLVEITRMKVRKPLHEML